MGRRCLWLLVLWTNVTLFGQLTIASAHARDHRQSSRIDFQLYRDYLIVLHPAVGALRGLNFLLDTGATPTVLDRQFADKLGLDLVSTDISVLQGTVRGWSATLPSLQVGPITSENLPVLIQDLSFVQKVVPVHLDGILGLDVLGHVAFTIDYTAREIRFGIAPDLPVRIPLQFKRGLAMVDATVDHQQIQLLLDTAAPSLFLFRTSPAPDLRTTAELSPSSIGDYDHRSIRLQTLTLGSASFAHPSAFVVASQRDAGHDFDGLVSPIALGITRLEIDLARGELAFSQRP